MFGKIKKWFKNLFDKGPITKRLLGKEIKCMGYFCNNIKPYDDELISHILKKDKSLIHTVVLKIEPICNFTGYIVNNMFIVSFADIDRTLGE